MIDANHRLPTVTGIALNTLIADYEGVMQLLDETCALLTDADLDRIVTFGHENEKRATIRWDYGIWRTIAATIKPILC